MAIDAVVRLDRIRCVTDTESGGGEPYMWTVLVTADSWANPDADTMTVSALDADDGSRLVIGAGLSRGERATIPAAQRELRHRFDRPGGVMIVVIAVLEKDEMPGDSIRAGYRRFVELVERELRGYVRARGELPLAAADQEAIASRIGSGVASRIKGSLSFAEKAKIAAGILDRDDVVGSANVVRRVDDAGTRDSFTVTAKITVKHRDIIASPSNAPPILGPERETTLRHYEIEGRFETSDPAARSEPRNTPTNLPRTPGTRLP